LGVRPATPVSNTILNLILIPDKTRTSHRVFSVLTAAKRSQNGKDTSAMLMSLGSVSKVKQMQFLKKILQNRLNPKGKSRLPSKKTTYRI